MTVQYSAYKLQRLAHAVLLINTKLLTICCRTCLSATPCIETETRTAYEWVLIFDDRNDPARRNNRARWCSAFFPERNRTGLSDVAAAHLSSRNYSVSRTAGSWWCIPIAESCLSIHVSNCSRIGRSSFVACKSSPSIWSLSRGWRLLSRLHIQRRPLQTLGTDRRRTVVSRWTEDSTGISARLAGSSVFRALLDQTPPKSSVWNTFGFFVEMQNWINGQ